MHLNNTAICISMWGVPDPPRNTNTLGSCPHGLEGSSVVCTVVDENTIGSPSVAGSSASEEEELIQSSAQRAKTQKPLFAWKPLIVEH